MPRDQRESFFTKIGASSEERELFERFDAALKATQDHTNLIARSSWDERWERHYLDSTQIFDLLPRAAVRLLDIGSGGGFPGIPLAILASTRMPNLKLTLCDSVGKKARFLADVVAACGLKNTSVLAVRVENHRFPERSDVVTARAVTALDGLIGHAERHLSPDGVLVFPKGRRAQQEVDEAAKRWSFQLEKRPSITDPEASILLIRSPERIR
ncbi:MAG: 16S rRNA (guanine(527)-N(7))-methyltransferase RsmG [Pseudomonadota bacterium]